MLLTNIRSEVDDFLGSSKAINSDTKEQSRARSFQEIVRQQFRIQSAQANQLIEQACSRFEIARGKHYTAEEKQLMLDWMDSNHGQVCAG